MMDLNNVVDAPRYNDDLPAIKPGAITLKRIKLIIPLLILTIISTACNVFGEPESCRETISDTPDNETYVNYFTSMILVNQNSGAPVYEDLDGVVVYRATDKLAIDITTHEAVSIQVCVQERENGGKIAFNQTVELIPGFALIYMGGFEPGSYVLRVIIDDTLIKNFPFSTR
jgi:hypothetical protein